MLELWVCEPCVRGEHLCDAVLDGTMARTGEFSVRKTKDGLLCAEPAAIKYHAIDEETREATSNYDYFCREHWDLNQPVGRKTDDIRRAGRICMPIDEPD